MSLIVICHVVTIEEMTYVNVQDFSAQSPTRKTDLAFGVLVHHIDDMIL